MTTDAVARQLTLRAQDIALELRNKYGVPPALIEELRGIERIVQRRTEAERDACKVNVAMDKILRTAPDAAA